MFHYHAFGKAAEIESAGLLPGEGLGLLEEQLGALPLRSEAGDGPHLDLDSRVELLVPHVPHALDRGRYCFIL